MERYLITVFDLDDATFHLLTQEQYDETELAMDLGEYIYLEGCRGTEFSTPAELVRFCVKNNVKILGEEIALNPEM
ncbi:MAG: hypothetical protein ACW96N_00045 [Candidatus Thorarchaeota archaeon]